jgi:hypothetical protein
MHIAHYSRARKVYSRLLLTGSKLSLNEENKTVDIMFEKKNVDIKKLFCRLHQQFIINNNFYLLDNWMR